MKPLKLKPPIPAGSPVWAVANTGVVLTFTAYILSLVHDKLSADQIVGIVILAIGGWPMWEVGKRLFRGGAQK